MLLLLLANKWIHYSQLYVNFFGGFSVMERGTALVAVVYSHCKPALCCDVVLMIGLLDRVYLIETATIGL